MEQIKLWKNILVFGNAGKILEGLGVEQKLPHKTCL